MPCDGNRRNQNPYSLGGAVARTRQHRLLCTTKNEATTWVPTLLLSAPALLNLNSGQDERCQDKNETSTDFNSGPLLGRGALPRRGQH